MDNIYTLACQPFDINKVINYFNYMYTYEKSRFNHDSHINYIIRYNNIYNITNFKSSRMKFSCITKFLELYCDLCYEYGIKLDYMINIINTSTTLTNNQKKLAVNIIEEYWSSIYADNVSINKTELINILNKIDELKKLINDLI